MTTEAQAQVQVEEKDDGVRVECDGCGKYLKPDPEQALDCHECEMQWTFCADCMPDLTRDAVWLCSQCR